MKIEFYQLGQHKIIVHIPEQLEEFQVMDNKCHIVIGDKCQPVLYGDYYPEWEEDRLTIIRWALSVLFRKDKTQPQKIRRSSNIFGRKIRTGNRR
jgi:hypothetical protein